MKLIISVMVAILLEFHIVSAQPSSTAVSSAPNSDQTWTELRTWILDQLAAGRSADINNFPAKATWEKEVPIPSSFLIELLRASKDIRPGQYAVDIENALIEDELIFRSADIPFDVNFSHCHFKKKLDLSQNTFQKSVTLEYATFDDALILKLSKIGGDLKAQTSHFTNEKSQIDLSGIQVAGGMVFSGGTFAGSLWLQGAHVSLTADLWGARFTNSKATANFENMEIGGDLYLQGTISHPLVFESEVRFEGAKIGGIFQTSNYTVFNNLEAPPRFDDMQARTAKFSLQSFKGHPVFAGMTYDNFQMFEDDPNGEKLASLLDQAKYSSDIYARAEDVLTKNGRSNAANRVFFHQKAQETLGLPWYSKPWSWFLRIFIGYGRQPGLAFIWCLAVLVIGFEVFLKKNWMVLVDKKETGQEGSRHYNPFWYSLDLFAPVIDLGTAKLWEPGPNHRYPRFARQYAHIHKILGWILIPIAVAAMTGYIK